MPPLSELPAPPEEPTGDELPALRTAVPGPMSRAASERLAGLECPAVGLVRTRRADAAGLERQEAATLVLSSGTGANLVDADGNRFVDFAAGFGSVLLGHRAPSISRAIAAQADRLVQALGDVYSADNKAPLLERLASLHPGASPRVLLTQSGSDAVTAACKTAMLATSRPGVIAFRGAYHGLGYAPLAACGLRSSYREPFAAQLSPHVTFAPYPANEGELEPAFDAIEAACRAGNVGAVLVEPILGRGGCVVPPAGFLSTVGEIARRHGALVIADEIWTGLGRAGTTLRSKAAGLEPDVICLGKGLGGGVPISACIAPDAIMSSWARDDEVIHTSTHAGNPLACAAAIATLDTLRFRKLPQRAGDVGARFAQALQSVLSKHDCAEGAVRGAGLMLGIAPGSVARAARLGRALLERGYIVLAGGEARDVLTLTPPLTIAEAQLDGFVDALDDALRSIRD